MARAARSPEEAIGLFQSAFNAGEMDGLLELYDPEAVLARPGAPPVRGVAAIRAAITPVMRRRLTFSMRVLSVVPGEAGLALATAAWSAEGTNEDGRPLRLFGTCDVVMRRQGDGTWRYLIDDPGFGHEPAGVPR